MQSAWPIKQLSSLEKRLRIAERFNNFFYTGQDAADILIDVEVVDSLPLIEQAEPVFITYHFQDGKENWRLLKKGGDYIYKSPLENREQIMLVNWTFDRVQAFLLSKKNKSGIWEPGDIIYDFLQVLLINYFAQRKTGIFTHAIGVKDVDGQGFLFAGKSGAGKSTTARLWHKCSQAMVLNDDRVIVRKMRDEFIIYGSPWHGDFSDYLYSRIEPAALKKVFFIHHAGENKVREVSLKEAFTLLYPALFPVFWDNQCLANIVSFCDDLIRQVDCFSLGFVKNKKIIDFVRKTGKPGGLTAAK